MTCFTVRRARSLAAACLLAATLCPGCLSDEDSCRMANMDCLCDAPGQMIDRCVSLDEWRDCEPAPLPPCYWGSNCTIDYYPCDTVCIEVEPDFAPRCNLDGLVFDGPGGIAVGHTGSRLGDPVKPVVLTSRDHGRSWAVLMRETLPPGCDAQRIAEVRFRSARTGWLRVEGEGAGCEGGLYRTTDGGASFDWLPSRTADGSALALGALLLTPAAPTWLLAGGPRLALSQDDGETWELLGAPPAAGGDASEVPVVTGVALPEGPSLTGCIASRPGTAVSCGPLDGTAWEPALDLGQPVLALADNGTAQRRMTAVTADDERSYLYDTSDGGLSWSLDPYHYAPHADWVVITHPEPGHGYLELWREDGLLDVAYRLGADQPWQWWLYALNSSEPYLVTVAFVHTMRRIWSITSHATNGFALRYTGGIGGTSVPSLPMPVTFTGIHLGLGAAPVAPW